MQRFYDRCVNVVVVEATDGRWSTRGQGVFLFRHDHVPIFINNDNLHHVGGLSEKKWEMLTTTTTMRCNVQMCQTVDNRYGTILKE